MFPKKEIILDLQDSDIRYYPNFFGFAEANSYYRSLLETTKWRQDSITLFGKTHPQPRLTALFANNDKPYGYSNITMTPSVFTDALLEIKNRIETKTDVAFTTCLANLYRNGQDSNGWHSDDEKALGKNPTIASVTFGEARYFHLKHKRDKTLRQKLLLENGSLLLMQGETQHHWLHQIAKTKRQIQPRINLTFRVIK